MIGILQGEVIFSDGVEVILLTANGIGYQVYYNKILAEGVAARIYISHVIKEAGEELFGFSNLREKKIFEQLISVKGVGPKSGYSLIGAIGASQVVEAITFENKKILTKAPGVGPKAAAQIILDLSDKIKKVQMYTNKTLVNKELAELPQNVTEIEYQEDVEAPVNHQILDETIMACKELGFNEDQVMTLAQKILSSNEVTKPEQLVHLVLKEI